MRKITSFLICGLFAVSSVFAEDITLSFDEDKDRGGITYTGASATMWSENPIIFQIENWDNRNMWRFHDNAPVLADYSGIEIEFDYETVEDIPATLQFFFSTNGFGRGYYPFFTSDLAEKFIEGTTTVVINFTKEDYPNLFVDADGNDVAETTVFDRFGIRLDTETVGTGKENNDYPTEVVKLRRSALIKKDGTKEYFNYLGGGMFNFPHAFRLYGESANFTMGEDGFIAWDLEGVDVNYVNVHLKKALTADVVDDLIFEYQDLTEVPANLITGLEVGSKLIVLDLSTLEVEQFSLYSPSVASIELDVEKIVISAEGAQQNKLDEFFAADEMPAFVNVYSVSGQLIKKQVARETVFEELPNGIYIVNNKKFAVFK